MVPYKIAVPSYANFAFMVILVSVFTLLWFKKDTGYSWQSLLIPYGRMSLTNYISQSIMGVTIYYGFGLSMYKYAGATGSLLIALLIFTIQLIFSAGGLPVINKDRWNSCGVKELGFRIL